MEEDHSGAGRGAHWNYSHSKYGAVATEPMVPAWVESTYWMFLTQAPTFQSIKEREWQKFTSV